jgi:hypothetical protein
VSAVVYESDESREWLLSALQDNSLWWALQGADVSPGAGRVQLEAALQADAAALQGGGGGVRGRAAAGLRLCCALLACDALPSGSPLVRYWLGVLAEAATPGCGAPVVRCCLSMMFLLLGRDDTADDVRQAAAAAGARVLLQSAETSSADTTSAAAAAEAVWWRTHVLLHADTAGALRERMAEAVGLPSRCLPRGLETSAGPRVAAVLGPTGALGTESIAAALVALPVDVGGGRAGADWAAAEAALQSATLLLEAGVLQRSQTDVLAMVKQAVSTATPPLRPALPALIRAHAAAAGVGVGGNGGVGAVGMMPMMELGLPTTLLRELLLSEEEGGWAPRALAAYYVLCFEETRHNRGACSGPSV